MCPTENPTDDPVGLVTSQYSFPFPLYEFQQEAVEDLCELPRSALFMDIGCGKTVTSTVLALYKGLTGEIDQIIILMPPILLLQWARWLRSIGLNVLVYKGTPVQRRAMDLSTDAVLMSFQIFKRDYAALTSFFEKRRVFVIVDEAAAIRRPQTLTFTAVKDFVNLPNKQLTMLTGTAINKPYHCYGYIALKTPTVYRDWRQFVTVHITGTDQYDEPSSYTNLGLLAENMALNSVRIRAEDVLELPPVVYVPIEYELEPAHQRAYNKLVEEKLLELEDNKLLDGTTQQRLYHTCQRLILTATETFKPVALQFVEALAEELNIFSGSGEKIVVYVNYKDSNEAVFAHVKSVPGLNPIQAYGKIGADGNLRNVDRFLSDPSINVLIANPRSIGIGLNLQGVCRAVQFLELPLTSNDFSQAMGRVYRDGQKKKCIVQMAVAVGTIQTELKKRVVQKEDLVQKLMPTKQTLRLALYGR